MTPINFCPSCGGVRPDGCHDAFHDNYRHDPGPDHYWLRLTEEEAKHLLLAVRFASPNFIPEEWAVLGPLEPRLHQCSPAQVRVAS